MESEPLRNLLVALPDWQSRLLALTAKFPNQGADVPAVSPGNIELPKNKNSKLQPRPSTPPSTTQPTEVGNKKLLAKPGGAKAKFSSITGPEIFYDGDSQQCLFECWTAMNTNRGLLRKEMMQIKRKKVLTLPTTDYGYDDSDDEIEAESDEDEESEEDRLKRLEEERRQREEEKKKAEMILKISTLLEEVDACLDKAARACENSAFLWLKGEGCAGHIVFIKERMDEAIARINKEIRPVEKPVEKPAPAPVIPVEGLDEGVEMDGGLEVDEGFDEEEEDIELPHKKISRPVPDPDPEGRQRRVRLE